MSNINIIKAKLRQATHDINFELEHGQSVIFQGRGSVVKKTEFDNQDGTLNVTYDIKPEIMELRASDGKSVQSVIKEKSRSSKLRSRCFMLAQELGVSEEALYNSAMDEATYYLDRKQDEMRLGV